MKSNNPEKDQSPRLIPKNEHSCIWMNCGIIDYKLCDLQFKCEDCLFDKAMRSGRTPEVIGANGKPYITFETPTPPSLQPIPSEKKNISIDRFLDRFTNPPLPEDRLYHGGHTWAKWNDDKSVKVGIDGYAVQLLELVKLVIPPGKNTRLNQGHSAYWIVDNPGTISFLSPITGNVTLVNDQLLDHPEWIKRDPYDSGWLFTMEPSNLAEDKKNLFPGSRFQDSWTKNHLKLKNKFDIAFQQVSRRSEVGVTLADGGTTISYLSEIIGKEKYLEIVNNYLHRGI